MPFLPRTLDSNHIRVQILAGPCINVKTQDIWPFGMKMKIWLNQSMSNSKARNLGKVNGKDSAGEKDGEIIARIKEITH